MRRVTSDTADDGGYTESPLGLRGIRTAVDWAHPGRARARATALVAAYRAHRTEVIRNPHLEQDWAAAAVSSPVLLDAVRAVVGQNVAVENSFLVMKWPGQEFEVPWHQDGIDGRIELAPGKSVAAWLALTDATATTGCLDVIVGSHRRGYLPYGPEAETGRPRGRADTVRGEPDGRPISLPVRAGRAVLMDMRLLHRSGSNTGNGVRVGLNVRYVAPGACLRRDPTCPSLFPVSGLGWPSRSAEGEGDHT
ncbi:phytanoyl-CoA dioxygenase family protein [Streptomyces cyaneofuscatus]|uniref:phytanoyl-CoA dioxygenase family protein n=1 Tax=Streptomyces cyaneofuscatus TaxID=66883 RepID=UPI0036DEB99E